MHGCLARWFLQAQEAMLGRTTFRLLKEHPPGIPLDPRQLAEERVQKVCELLEHARSRIPYWAERLRGWSPQGRSSVAELLRGIPVLTRSEIRRHAEQMRWREAPGKLLQHRSGGTTDDNLTFFWSRERQSWDRAMRYRGFARLGIFPGDRILHLWPCYPGRRWSDRLRGGLRQLRDWLTNDVVVEMRPFTPERLRAVVQICRRYRPRMLIGYPSWLMALVQWLEGEGQKSIFQDLRCVLCAGEVLFDFQRRKIERVLQVPVYQEYGSQDAGLIAHEDSERVLWPNLEQMHVEILHEGEPVAPGELGEVVITHFHNRVMPFIRYATGDVMRQEVHSPGANMPVPCPLPQGRISDQLVSVEGQVRALRPIVEGLVERAGLEDFSLYQPEPGAVSVLYVERPERLSSRQQAEAVLREHLGPIQIDWSRGRGFVPLTSGKKRYACGLPAIGLLAHDRIAGVHLARAWPQRLLPMEKGA